MPQLDCTCVRGPVKHAHVRTGGPSIRPAIVTCARFCFVAMLGVKTLYLYVKQLFAIRLQIYEFILLSQYLETYTLSDNSFSYFKVIK
jgi:hypothetical protein